MGDVSPTLRPARPWAEHPHRIHRQPWHGSSAQGLGWRRVGLASRQTPPEPSSRPASVPCNTWRRRSPSIPAERPDP